MWFLYYMEKVYKFCQISEIKYLSLIDTVPNQSTAQSSTGTELLSTNHVWFSCITGCEVVSE